MKKPEEKTHWKKNFNYNYLGSYSLNDSQEVTLTILRVIKELVIGEKGQEDDCTVAYFKEDVNGENKPMILNKTNCKSIEKLYDTPFIKDWTGKRVTIYVENVKVFGDYVDALRVKKIKPVDQKPTLDPNHSKWEAVKSKVASGTKVDAIRKHYEITDENFALLCG